MRRRHPDNRQREHSHQPDDTEGINCPGSYFRLVFISASVGGLFLYHRLGDEPAATTLLNNIRLDGAYSRVAQAIPSTRRMSFVNNLSREKQIEIIAASLKVGQLAVAHLTGSDRKTVARLALRVGRGERRRPSLLGRWQTEHGKHHGFPA
jgi:hypothetical protein